MVEFASAGVPMTVVGNEESIKRFAVVEDGKVVNVINWDSVQPLPSSLTLIEAPDEAGVGWDYVEGNFVDNRPRGHQDGDVWVVDVENEELESDA